MDYSNLFVLRPVVASDVNYIMDSWLRDLRQSDRGFLPNDIWYPAHRDCLQRVLADSRTTTLILADIVNTDVIVGFIVKDDTYLHWVHVRPGEWRNNGLAKYMLQQTGSTELASVWSTQHSKAKLKNQPRTQAARRYWWLKDK